MISSSAAAERDTTVPTSSGAVYACVVDSDPRFHLDALRWFATLTKTARIPADKLIVHTPGDAPSDVLQYLHSQDVDIRTVEPFDNRSPACNKISAALALASGAVADRLYVLTDSDVAIASDPAAAYHEATLAAKVVDAANPPLDLLQDVFELAGVKLPEIVQPDFDCAGLTIAGNLNGGVYLVPGLLLPSLAQAWAKWARWLLDKAILGRHSFFADQVAMAIALTQNELDVAPLGREWNFPVHIRAWIRADADPPAAVHYHNCIEPTGLISTTGNPAVDGVIATLNEAISAIWHEAFPNQTFWDWRYKSNPSLGSGMGSRGGPLRGKRRLLRQVVARVQPTSVLDVGCGDGEATRGLRLRRYTGLDVSEEALRLSRASRPDGRFHLATITDWSEEAELTICLDVLIHQADADTYRQTVEALLRAATRVLLVSGYERPPSFESPMIHFHEPLSATIRGAEPTLRLHKVREVHGMTTFAVVRPPFDQNWPRHRLSRRAF